MTSIGGVWVGAAIALVVAEIMERVLHKAERSNDIQNIEDPIRWLLQCFLEMEQAQL